MAGFRNNFQNHRRVSEQLFKTQAAIRKAEQALQRGLQEGLLTIVDRVFWPLK
jgi:hypothetical protein